MTVSKAKLKTQPAFRKNPLILIMFPYWKTYVFPGGNVCFCEGKHKKQQGTTASLPNHFNIPLYPFWLSNPERP